jgi:hypothetical protein
MFPERRIPCPVPGALAEWLGRGLQSLVRRFESARRLYREVLEPAQCGEEYDSEDARNLMSILVR